MQQILARWPRSVCVLAKCLETLHLPSPYFCQQAAPFKSIKQSSVCFYWTISVVKYCSTACTGEEEMFEKTLETKEYELRRNYPYLHFTIHTILMLLSSYFWYVTVQYLKEIATHSCKKLKQITHNAKTASGRSQKIEQILYYILGEIALHFSGKVGS